MAHDDTPTPVWALATEPESLPGLPTDGEMTPERLSELRMVLASFANSPVATLEMHPLERPRDSSGGIALRAASPLGKHLSDLVGKTARSGGETLSAASSSGEVLYRMVVPAKVAADMSAGLVKPMRSPAVRNGIYGGLRGSKNLVGHATFVPVTTATGGAAAGATAGAATAAGVTTAGAMTVAAPLVLMAVAVGASAYADHEREKAIERITDLLESLHDARIEDERNRLDGCRDAIERATSLLLDQGKIGQSLGLDSASHDVDVSMSAVRSRLKKWSEALEKLGDGPVDVDRLEKAFPGILEEAGEFHLYVEMARLTIALKRRLLVLQAVEHAQMEGSDNPFKLFLEGLRDAERRVNDLEASLDDLLLGLSSLEVQKRSGVFSSVYYSPGDVDKLLKAVYRLKSLGLEVRQVDKRADVVIEIERSRDGSLVVFPAAASEE